MKIFFISDLHLNENNLDSYNLFVKFINELPADTKAIYILGDLFEFWIDDYLNNSFINKIKDILKHTTTKLPIYIIKGNRDFLLGEKFATDTGTILLPDLFTLDLYGNKILLMHGDLLCTKDVMYIRFAKFIRHPITIWILNRLPIVLKLMLAKLLRKLSINKKKKYKALKFSSYKQNNNFHAIYDVYQGTVEKNMQQYHVEILIHGHTHKPNVYNFISNSSFEQKHLTRIVLGDWDHEAKILEFTPAGYELKNISI